MAFVHYDYTVFIGRFQPPHNGHFKVIEHALRHSENLIIIVGSHMRARSAYRLPFTTEERIEMLREGIPSSLQDRVMIVPVEDYRYNLARWTATVQSAVYGAIWGRKWTPDAISVALVGHSKDASSFYLNNFPQWDSINVENYDGVNATDIRDEIFGMMQISTPSSDIILNNPNITDAVPEGVAAQLDIFIKNGALDGMAREYGVVRKYRKSWDVAPYTPVFVTTDAVVVQSGHLLVVERGDYPGFGNLALPGGFLNSNEQITDGMIRELREETRLTVPEPVIRGSIERQMVFDDPYRSSRGRTITHASLIRLRDDFKLPKVKGGDDAAKAFWMPLSDFKAQRANVFEDHYDVVETLVGGI